MNALHPRQNPAPRDPTCRAIDEVEEPWTPGPYFLEGSLTNKALIFPKNRSLRINCYSKYAHLYKRSTSSAFWSPPLTK